MMFQLFCFFFLNENLTLTSVFIKSVARNMHGSRGWGPGLSLEFENFTYKKVISGFFGWLDPPLVCDQTLPFSLEPSGSTHER